MIAAMVDEVEDRRWEIPISRRALPKRTAGIAKIITLEQKAAHSPYAKNESIVPVETLKKKLGATTYRVWSALLTIRNKACETHPSLRGLSKVASVKVDQLRKSLDRLRDFKLVDDLGWMYRRVPCRCPKELGHHLHKIYVRMVFGSVRADTSGETHIAVIPRAAAERVQKAAGQGGARKGAGRPKGKLDSAPRRIIKGGSRNSNVAAYKYQELVSYEETTSLQRNVNFSLSEKAGETVAPCHGAKCISPDVLTLHTQPQKALGTSSLQPKRTVKGSKVSLLQPQSSFVPPPFRHPDWSDAPNAASDDGRNAPALRGEADGQALDLDSLFSLPEGTQSITIGGTGKPRRQQLTPEDMQASVALNGQLFQFKVPAPPSIKPSQTADERLHLLKLAFRAAHQRVLRQDYWRPPKAMTAKEREAQLHGAQALETENISPTAWALFSLEQWVHLGKRTAPSARWVWSAQRIHEHARWCRDEVGSMASWRTIQLPAVTELILRVGAMRERLGWGRPTAVVVQEMLPDAIKRDLLAQAAMQRAAMARTINDQIKAGEWVWG